MQLKNPSSVGPAFILVGFALVFVFSLVYAVCAENTSSCSFSSGLGIVTFLPSLGSAMILSGAILTAAGHIVEHLRPASSQTLGIEKTVRACSKCGRETEADAAFCSRCGNPMGKPQA